MVQIILSSIVQYPFTYLSTENGKFITLQASESFYFQSII